MLTEIEVSMGIELGQIESRCLTETVKRDNSSASSICASDKENHFVEKKGTVLS